MESGKYKILGAAFLIGCLAGLSIHERRSLAATELLKPATVRQRLFSKKKISTRQFKPVWSANRKIIGYPAINATYISNFDRTRRSESATMLDRFFDDKSTVRQMRYQYERFVAECEAGRVVSRNESGHFQYDRRSGRDLQQACVDQNRNMTKEFVRVLKNKEFGQQRNELRTHAINETSQEVQKPIEVVGGLAAIYFGEPLMVNIGPTRIRAQPKVREQKGEYSVSTPILDSQFIYAEDLNRSDSRKPREKYWLNFSRDLPFFGLSSGLSYGSTSNLVTASLGRMIAPNLRCTVSTSHSTIPDPWAIATEQDSLSLSYELRF